MYSFETPEMTQPVALKFRNWFNKTIGTDYEQNVTTHCGSRYYILMDMEREELQQVKQYFK